MQPTEFQPYLFPMEDLTSYAEELPARTSALPENATEWPKGAELEALFLSILLNCSESSVQDGSSGKTFLEHCRATTGQISDASCPRLMRAGILCHGEYLMLNMYEHTNSRMPYLREDAVCSLSDILEMSDIPPKYYLSETACAGILRRASKRGKELPAILREALQNQMILMHARCKSDAESPEEVREL